ncbi:MAG: hypothetical protein WC966_01925 [Bradymonadales bacterium]|jgi:hypothetical protein
MPSVEITLTNRRKVLVEYKDKTALSILLQALAPDDILALHIKGLELRSALRELPRFTQLETLVFEQCQELFTFPKELRKLDNLRHLSIYDCPDFHRWDDVEELTQLHSLSVERCHCITFVPPELAVLNKLIALSLRHNEQLYSIAPQVGNLPLLILDIHGCIMLDPLPVELEKLPLRSENMRDLAKGEECLKKQAKLENILERLEKSKYQRDYAGYDD